MFRSRKVAWELENAVKTWTKEMLINFTRFTLHLSKEKYLVFSI